MPHAFRTEKDSRTPLGCLQCGRVEEHGIHAVPAPPPPVVLTPEEADERIRSLEAALCECARLSGVDIEYGPSKLRSIESWAIQAVKDMRDVYDEGCGQ